MKLIKTLLSAVCVLTLWLTAPQSHVLGMNFPIATNGAAMSCAFDGINYLVGVENHLTATPTIGAQMMSSNGAKVGALITTGRSGIATAIAFDGTNYLMIWEDDGMGTLNDGSRGWQIYGQFINKAGTAASSPFAITTLGIWFDGIKTMAFGGGKYLVTYTRLLNPELGYASTRYIAGRIVNPDGTMGSEFRISTGSGKASDVAFDGANFFVIWCEASANQEIRGRFVSLAGVAGTEIAVNASAASSDNPISVTFDGINYMVVWNDEVGGKDTGTWDSFGQLVSTSGALVGGAITITSEPGPQMVTSVAFDGVNYMAVWVDMQNGANWDMYGQYISRNGSLAGSKITISTDTGNQMGGVGFANGKYLVLVNNGVIMGQGGISRVDSATGMFVTPPANQYYMLTVTGGSGGGSYTNGAQVTITSDAPPAGQIFDRWGDATQYVANVTSSTTTVTMPAMAITLTAIYKRSGELALVEDGFDGSASAPPDGTKFEWGGEVTQNGSGQLHLQTWTLNQSWLRSKAGAAPGLGQTLVLQMRAAAYAEDWTPGIYGDMQPRGLRVGSDDNNVVEFYSLSSTSVGLRMRKDGVESLAACALPSRVDSMHDYEIAVTTTSVCFKVDGVLAATFTTNIPTGVLNVYVSTSDGGFGNVPLTLDSLSLALTPAPTKIIGVSGNLAFGNVTTGQTATATMTITNSGNATLTVTNITYPTGFSGAWGGTVAAGGSQGVTVTFSPMAVTTYNGTVTVNADQTSGGNTIIASGTGTSMPANQYYMLTVTGGSGGGSYTNGAQVTITSEAPPAGQIFDRWGDATQYVANVTSSTTTVTMPAMAITLTAIYKRSGELALVEDGFDGSASAPPDGTKFEWGGEVTQNGSGQLHLQTWTLNQSWLRSKAGAAPGLGQTLVLQMRAAAYAEDWTPGIYGDMQPRGLRVGSDDKNVVEFYSLSSTSVGLRMRKDGVESLAACALPSRVDSMHDYEITVTTTSVCFKVDGVLAATFTTNIPTGVFNVYVSTSDGGFGNVPLTLDSLSLALTGSQVQGPPAIAGCTFTAFDTGDPTTKTIIIGTTTFVELNNGVFNKTGTYTYTALSANSGKAVFLRDGSAANSDTVIFTFITATNGTYSNTRVRGGVSAGTRTGTFTASVTQPLPQLTIFLSGAKVILTWPANATGFALQSTTNLVSPAVWSTVTPAPVVVNGQNAVTNLASGTQKFFRLSQ